MSVRACLPALQEQGKMSPEQAQEVAAQFDDLQADFSRQFDPETADALASEALLSALDAAASRRRFIAGKTIQARGRIEADMAKYGGAGKSGDARDGGGGSGGGGSDGPPDSSGPIDPRSGPAFLAADDRAPYSNVEGRMRAIRGRAHGMIDRILSEHSTNLLGKVRNRAQLVDIVRELFGENSGSLAAREMAEAWSGASEMLRQRFNAAGGGIGKMDRWGLPQSHDSRAVRAAGFDEWRAEILPRLDRQRMVDRQTGLPFSDEKLELVLRDIFETIRSDGWAGRNPGAGGPGSLANRRADARFLHFKSADDWLAYHEAFGAGSAFDAMMGHIDGIARDTAMLEILGPNPDATIRWMKDTITKSAQVDAAPGTKAVDAATKANRAIDRLAAELNGDLQRPENRNLGLAFSSLRSLQTAAKLGGAMLSAVSDVSFQGVTRAFNGLPVRSMMGDYVKLFRPGAIEDQKLAVRLGLIAEEWSNRTAAQNRFLGEELTGETSRRLAEATLRASGLTRWTQAGRWAFGMEFLGTITDRRAQAWADLEPPFRAMFTRNGLFAADWDAIRKTRVEMERGVEWIKPANVTDAALGDRMLEMIARETDLAVPVPDLRSRALIHSVAPPGTWHGEIIKSAALFKSFGISVMLQHGGRAMAMAGPNRARYVAGLTIATTLGGALAIWLKDIAAGRDPRDATNSEFWLAALLQGGGFGIFGDFLKSTQNRAGGGLAQTLAGPLVDDIQGIANIASAREPDAAAIKEARQWLPGGTLWYARTAFDRMVTDQLIELTDPDYRKSWRRAERWAEEQGTEYWWEPGDVAPDRAPDFEQILGGDQDDR